VLVPTTQEVWFIRGYCRYLGATEIIPWPIGPLYNAMPSIETLDDGDDMLVTSNKTELPLETKYIDDIIRLLRQKKKRIQKHKHRLTPNQRLQKQEADRIKNSTTLLKRSTRCTLPDVVDEEEAKQYYKS
jgi:hypothetical protein